MDRNRHHWPGRRLDDISFLEPCLVGRLRNGLGDKDVTVELGEEANSWPLQEEMGRDSVCLVLPWTTQEHGSTYSQHSKPGLRYQVGLRAVAVEPPSLGDDATGISSLPHLGIPEGPSVLASACNVLTQEADRRSQDASRRVLERLPVDA